MGYVFTKPKSTDCSRTLGCFPTQANIFKMIKENFKKVKNTKKSYLDSIEKSYF